MNAPEEQLSLPLVLRSALGGVLMGLANLVPGISGGTMLLAVGIYPRFIDAVARVTRLRCRVCGDWAFLPERKSDALR